MKQLFFLIHLHPMKKARLYLAIFAYVILIKRMVNQTLRRAFYLYRRGDRLIQRFKSIIISKTKKTSCKPLGSFVFSSSSDSTRLNLCKGHQIQILRI